MDNKQKKEFFLGLLTKHGSWVAALLILLVAMLVKHFDAIFLWMIVGGVLVFLITAPIAAWHKKECMSIIKKDGDSNGKISLKGLPWWYWAFIGIEMVFFALAGISMFRGLDLCNVGKNDYFEWILVFIVCITFLFVMMRITIGNTYWGYVIFFLILDLFAAFIFNYTHFYNTISEKQHLDADMRACTIYVQNIDPIVSKVQASYSQAESTIKHKKENALKANDDRYDDYQKKLNDVNAQLGATTSEEQRESLEKQKNNLENQIAKLIRNPGSNQSADNEFSTTSTQAEIAKNIQTNSAALMEICRRYKRNNKNFELELADDAKRYVVEIDGNLHELVESDKGRFNPSMFENDSVKYALERIKRPQSDMFEGIKMLGKTIGNTLMPSKDDKGMVAKNSNSSKDDSSILSNGSKLSEVQQDFLQEDKESRNMLMLMSLILSLIIDALPVVLGVIVRYDLKFEMK